MQENLKEFSLDELFDFQRNVALFDPNDEDQEEYFSENEEEFLKKYLNKERIDQKLKKTKKKELFNLIYDSICQRIVEGKERVLGDEENPLDLSDQSRKNLRKLSEALQKDDSIEEMHLVLDGISMQILFETIQSKNSLKRLKIGEILDDVGAYLLSKALESNDTLEELHLILSTDRKIKESSSKFLFNFLKKNKSLKKIHVSENDFKEKESMNQYLQRLKKKNGLKRISFPKMEDQKKETKLISKCLQNNPQLEQIDLYKSNLDSKGMKSISESLQNCTNLKKIDFYNNQIADKGTKLLFGSVKQNSSLKELNLASNKIGKGAIKYISEYLKQNPSLEILILSRNDIGDEGIKYLCESLIENKNLKVLDVNKNEIGDEGIKYLSEFLKKNPSLEKIILSDNLFGDGGIKHLSEALKENTLLHKIDLSYNQVRDQGMKHLSGSLKQNSSLKKLKLCENKIGDEGIKFLQSFNLESINIQFNKVSKEGMKIFFRVLKSNHSLKKLYIDQYDTGDDVVSFLIDMIRVNRSIIQVDIYPGGENGETLKYLLNCNVRWKPDNHLSFSEYFKKNVFKFVCCLKRIEKKLLFKFGRFILFEMIKRIDRKSFLHLDFAEKQPFDEEDERSDNRKRKRDKEEEN